MQRVPRDDRHHHVQFELSRVGRGEDRRVTPDHLVAHLVDHLGHGWIHLAGHDRRSRLHRWQLDLGDAGPRPHAEQPQIRGDLPHLHGQPPNRPRTREHVPHALGDAESVGRRAERRAGVFGQAGDGLAGVIVAGVEPGANGRRAEIQLEQLLGGAADLVGRMPDVGGEATELLPEGDRHRVLQVRPAGLQNRRERRRFFVERIGKGAR